MGDSDGRENEPETVLGEGLMKINSLINPAFCRLGPWHKSKWMAPGHGMVCSGQKQTEAGNIAAGGNHSNVLLLVLGSARNAWYFP